MDDVPYTGDLDLDAVSTRDDLASLLRTVHVRADEPSLRTLEARTRHSATVLSKTTVAEMLKAVRFPRRAVMVAFLRACGVQDDALESWQRAWERAAAGEKGLAPPGPAQITFGRHGHAAEAGQYPVRATENAEGAAPVGKAGSDRPAGASTASAELGQLHERINRLSSDNERLRGQLAETQRRPVEELPPVDPAISRRAHSPVVRRRELGVLLRALRAAKGITVEQVAGQLMCSTAKVRRMESGFRSGTARDVRDLCELYGVTEAAERDHLMELARESKKQGWWQPYDVPYSTYIGLEAEAVSIKAYHPTTVDGLLQTADYARALYATLTGFSAEAIEQGVEARLIRQRLLTEADPPCAWFIMDEAALHRVVGGPATMRAQLEQLFEVARLPNVTIQVIPYEAGAYSAMESSFTTLEFAAPIESVVYVEGLIDFIHIDRHQDVERYQLVFEELRSMACDQEESVERIAKVCKDIGGRS